MPGPGGVLVALRPLPFAPPGLLGGQLGPLVWAGGADRRPLVWGSHLGALGCHRGRLSALNGQYVPAGPDFQALFP